MKMILAGLAATFTLNLYAQPLMLVTEAEAKASIEAGGLPTPRSSPQPGAPRIELLSPDVKKPISVPTKIEVKFSGNPPAEPKPETFKALYGAFKIDITQRLLGVAKVTKAPVAFVIDRHAWTRIAAGGEFYGAVGRPLG
ncbi:MAG: hypothetical protein EB072_16085 [Betaproteobacteria bacterium]|nr:hypothetical protein [Betaproteobacteria bacterium]